jgi:antitoxin component YwqK of YwqJK toxin-antitoxin module
MPSKTANFEENIKRWATYMPQEAEEIKKVDSQRIICCESEKGLPNLKTEVDGQTYFLHDPSDPQGEAKRWMKTLDLGKAEVVFVYGIGLGYYYDELIDWLRGNENRYLAFIEDDPEVIFRFMESDRAKTLLNDKQVRLFYITDFKKGVGRINNVASCFMGLRFKISAVQLYLRQKATSLMRLHTILSFLMKMYEVTDAEYRSFSVSFFLNYYLNLFSLPTSFMGGHLWGKWKNVPAIICGAGPSLDKNIDTLRTLNDKALIFAGSTSINALNAGGVTPHIGVGVDPNPAQLMRIVSNNSHQIPYFLNFRMNSYALNAIHGDHLYVNSGATYEIANWVDNKLGIGGEGVLEGYNVVNFALSLATSLGCSPIIVVGVDLAYSQEKSYTTLPPIHPLYHGDQSYITKSPEEDLIARKDINGETVFTLWKWLLESVWYSKFAMEYPTLEIINSTEGGLGFPGVENVPLKEVAEKYLQKEYDFEGFVHASIQSECQMPASVTEDKISGILKVLQTSMDSCYSYCEEITKEYKKLIEDIADSKDYPQNLISEKISKEIVKLDEEDAYQSVLSVYNQHIMQVMKKEIQKLELDKDWLDVDEVSQETAELHSVRFNLLRKAAEKNTALIGNAISANEGKTLSHKSHQSVSQNDQPFVVINPSPEDCYSLEDGMLTIKDSFLGINIRELFEGEPCVHLKGVGSQTLHHEGYLCNELLHGPSIYTTKEGQTLSSSWYYHGKRVGCSKRFYDDGTLYSVTRYVDDKQHGPQDYYYRDGVVRSQINYKDDLFDGATLLFFENGQLKREIHYKEGKKHGRETLWNYDGKQIGEFEFSEDHPIGTGYVWSPSGAVLKEVSFEEDQEIGEVKLWNEKGEILEFPKEQGKDYFDLVAIKMEEFTESLSEIAKNLETLGPILEKENPENTKFVFSELKNDVNTIKEQIVKLLELNMKLKEEAGLNQRNQKEAIWKTPSTQELLRSLIEQMVEQLREQIVAIQNAFIDIIQSVIKKHPEIKND